MVINDELEICGLNFSTEVGNTLFKALLTSITFPLFNSEGINHTNYPFTHIIAISDIALLNAINKELNIIITLGMNKEY